MKDKFLEFAKTPLGTAIAIGLYVIIMVIYIMSKTSFGKKIYSEAKFKVQFVLDKFKEHKEETEKKLKEQKEWLESKLKEANAKINELENFVCEIGKTINNKKVKELVKWYEEHNVGELSGESEKESK